MKKFKVSRPAKEDLDEIWLHIAQDSLDAADRFVDYLTDRFPLLASSPRMGRTREDLAPGLRYHPVKNYVIYYRLQGSRIEIARVVRGTRDLKALFE